MQQGIGQSHVPDASNSADMELQESTPYMSRQFRDLAFEAWECHFVGVLVWYNCCYFGEPGTAGSYVGITSTTS